MPELRESALGLQAVQDKATYLAALTRAGERVEGMLLQGIQETSMAAVLGALATHYAKMLHTMRAQHQSDLADQGLIALQQLMESGRTTSGAYRVQ